MRQLVGPFGVSSKFVAKDFKMLESFEIKHCVGWVTNAIDEIIGRDDTTDA